MVCVGAVREDDQEAEDGSEDDVECCVAEGGGFVGSFWFCYGRFF